jgi:ATP-binding cassette subfamily B protein
MSSLPDRPMTGARRVDPRVLRRLLACVAPYRVQAAGAALALVAAASAVLAFGAGLRWLVDHGFSTGTGAPLDQALLAMLAIVVVLAAATAARAYLVAWIGERVAADLRRRVFDHVLGLSPGFFETSRVGDIISRLVADTTIVQTVVGSSVSMALRNALLVAGGTAMMAVASPRLTLVTLAVLPCVVAPIIVFGRRVRALSRASQDRLADTGAVLWIGGHDMVAGRISAGQLSAFVFYAVVVAGSVGSISEFIGDLQRAAGAAERLFELLDAAPDLVVADPPAPLPVPARGAVAFQDVRFAYPSRPDSAALDGVDFALAPGETVALVGPSGAGKSTVLNLAMRFRDPDGGRILFDGVDIATCDPAALRARIALVPQEPAIFAADVTANIAFGRPGASEAEIRAAAEAAQASAFIAALPQGFATHLGEKGQRLSVGQKQRIAIARAILRDPALLLLDEATSALDAESERAVQLALEKLSHGRTTLVVAHRLATVQRADRILVLDRGRLVEQGRHDALIAAGGLYARLAALQFLSAR